MKLVIKSIMHFYHMNGECHVDGEKFDVICPSIREDF